MRSNVVRTVDEIHALSSAFSAANNTENEQDPKKAALAETDDQRSPFYSIAWLDFFSKAVPLSFACRLSAPQAKFIIEKALHIPPSRNITRRRVPYGSTTFTITAASDFLFPKNARSVQVRPLSAGGPWPVAKVYGGSFGDSIGWRGLSAIGCFCVVRVSEDGGSLEVEGVCDSSVPKEGNVRVWCVDKIVEGAYQSTVRKLPCERNGPVDVCQATACTIPSMIEGLAVRLSVSLVDGMNQLCMRQRPMRGRVIICQAIICTVPSMIEDQVVRPVCFTCGGRA